MTWMYIFHFGNSPRSIESSSRVSSAERLNVTTAIVALDDGLWEADARAELDDLAEAIDPKLTDVDGDVDTLGGLAFVIAGHVPTVGDEVIA